MKKKHDYIAMTRDAARDSLLEKVSFSPAMENVPLTGALGRVAAETVRALDDLPNRPASQRDGVAVRFSAFEHGAPDTSGWKEGTDYVFSNTGIGILGDFDTVVRIEEVEFLNDAPVFPVPPAERGQLVSPAGSRMRKGDVLVERGDVLTPLLLAHLATGGHIEVPVWKKPRVAFIPTGNELLPPGVPLPPGKNTDSNSIMMYGKIVQWGGEPVMYPIQPDDPTALTRALEDALARADIVAINGGSSEGTDDYTIQVLSAVGTIQNHMILNGPGAHTSCTVSHGGKPIVGIPGPSVGAEFVADWFIKPLIDRYYGLPLDAPQVTAVYRGEDLPPRDTRNDLIRRAQLHLDGDRGGFAVALVPPGDVRTMSRCGALLPVPPTGLKSGAVVTVRLRWPYRIL